MNNPYLIDEPAIISFSGGRSSAYMLYHILEAHGGLPDHLHVYFANTGKEMEQTLEFVHECSVQWRVPITWVELGGDECEIKKTGRKYTYGTKEVNFDTASRNGEPFKRLIQIRSYLPNPVARFCTSDLKIRRIVDHAKYHGVDVDTHVVGIRADEPSRAAKMLSGDKDEGHYRHIPMYHDGVTKEIVADFWRAQQFDLNLPNNNGTTDWGNCDLCFLKGYKKKLSIIRDRPDLAQWWIEMEAMAGATFRKDEPGYDQKLIIATETGSLFDEAPETPSISCFCGE